MFSVQINKIKSALSGLFDGVYDSFDSLNMAEHMNKTLGFVEVSGYKLSEAMCDYAGRGYVSADVTFTVKALAKRTMTAEELTSLVDNHAVSVIRLSDLDIRSLERTPCIFSKAHGRYLVSFDIKVGCMLDSFFAPTTRVYVGDVLYDFFTDVEFSRSCKTYKLGTVQGEMISGIARNEPISLTLKGEVIASSAEAAHANIAQYYATPITLTVDSALYPNMVLCECSFKKDSKKAYITAKFSEVNV